MSSFARILVVILVIILVLLLAAVVASRKPRLAPKTGGGGSDVASDSDNAWWEEDLDPAARRALRRYAQRNIVATLRGGDKAPFDRALRQATAPGVSGRVRAERLKTLQGLLLRSELAKTAAGVGEGGRANKRAGRVVEVLPEGCDRRPVLDIGCGDGSISAAIAAALGTPRREVYCVEPGEKPKTFPKGLQWAREEADGTLPLPDRKFALVTALMSLHHVNPEVLPRLSEEIARVTRPGGVLVLREHDMESCGLPEAAARQYIDWVHILFDLAEGTKIADLEQSHYRTPAGWDSLFADAFELLGHHGYDPSTCAYYATYRRR